MAAHFATSDSTSRHGDTIVDFEEGRAQDQIDLHLIDANLSAANDPAFTFVAAQTAGVLNNSVTWY